ncbi:MAG: histidinol dehydrogenase [Candidatus Omnitrophica bacterium]|nr:histidinol dehydrogenase [Candidatus Omnitrophota bacterium]
MKIIRYSSKKLEDIYNRGFLGTRRLKEKVARILEDVRLQGDDALIRYTKKFDGVKLSAKNLRISEAEISGAYQNIQPDFITSLKEIIENITRFYRRQIKKCWKMKDAEGAVLGENYHPLDRVGIYIPAGQAPLVSTVYMTVLPAKIAGVKQISLVSPPDKSGNINPHILVVANLLKVNEIYRLGGAQAVAAMAFGTKTIPKVDKIIGPGNVYVTEAKRQVFGFVDIDMLAGPSELVIIASRYSDPKLVIADIKAQKEHSKAQVFLVTNSRALARQVRASIEGEGYIILTKNLDEAVEIANRIAPEHLEILVKKPSSLVKKIKNAGAIFLGPYSPVAIGDYFAGPSHVLPTGGSARFFSGLNLSDFIKSNHVISYTRKALEKAKGSLEKIAGIEGLIEHANSVKARFT